MFRYLTSGESHGEGLYVILEGVPAGLKVDLDYINHELSRRQLGYGRGERMKIEKDEAQILTGVRGGFATGAPITIKVKNRDYENWEKFMRTTGEIEPGREVTVPRPGHADLAGGLKYGHKDLRNVLERASARETAVRVAAGAVAKLFLAEFGVRIYSHVLRIGSVEVEYPGGLPEEELKKADEHPLRCLDAQVEGRMLKWVDRARENGDTLGGIFEVVVFGLPPGLGSYVHWDRKLDGRLAGALMAIPSAKGVEIGDGIALANIPGRMAVDEIYYENGHFYRKTNRAGGLEGGVTNGMPLIAKVSLKPIPTQVKPLKSVDIVTKETKPAQVERSDITAVPAAGVVGEAVTALVLMESFLEKFGGDRIEETKRNYQNYLQSIANY
ncbi:chorismate synthase [Carboxydothermus ferrireducens]|uniref:Chorismate synthase n=1 Tax=Carboxydothermus ferrireducens DSM 11255 TaxID=1119529 RepID=A0ABX2R7F9_9THEO|nr:chorismate synthase [Carboxydothermus ferrireducens]NYE56497.1 chorismate synthase [Carboxydothermus ferrireducens DSM 11255]